MMRLSSAELTALRRIESAPAPVGISSASSGVAPELVQSLAARGLVRKLASSSAPGRVGLGRMVEITAAGRAELALRAEAVAS